MSGYKPISTAPRDGTIVELKSERHIQMPAQRMFWTGEHWQGLTFTPTGSRRIYWSNDDPPTHWRALQ